MLINGPGLPVAALAAPMTIRAGTLATLLVAVATLASTIVLSEPAIADALMLVVIVALPVLGCLPFGPSAHLNYALLLALVALGLAGTMLSTTFDTAFVQQLVTLFLARRRIG